MEPNSPRYEKITPKTIQRFFFFVKKYGDPVKASVAVASTADAQITLLSIYWRKAGVPDEENPVKRRKKYSYLTNTEKQTIVQLLISGKSVYAISEKTGRYTSTIYYFLKRVGLK